MMNGLNGIILNGKIFEAVTDKEDSCLNCDLINDTGDCVCRDFCFEQGRCNIFRFSPTLTDKINEK